MQTMLLRLTLVSVFAPCSSATALPRGDGLPLLFPESIGAAAPASTISPATTSPGADAPHAAVTTPPVVVPDEVWRPLVDCADSLLQRQMERGIARRPGWAKLARAGKLSVGLVDLTRIEQPRFAQVNGDTMLQVASLAKIAILLGPVTK